MEVYNIDKPSKDKLEEICDLRQPIIFDYHKERIIDSCNLNNLNGSYGAFDVKLRDTSNKDENGETLSSTQALEDALGQSFKRIAEPKDIPFVIRETKRKYQHTLSEFNVFEKIE